MISHTKAPWAIDEQGNVYHRPDPLTKYVIARMESGSEADGNLIAAAPDLYAAASKLLAAFDELQHTSTAHLRNSIKEALADLLAARSKAEEATR